MSSQELADALNDYYVEVGGTPSPITTNLQWTSAQVRWTTNQPCVSQ